MNNILYLVAVVLVVGWIVGVVGYSASGLIHVLLIIALVSLILGVIRRSRI